MENNFSVEIFGSKFVIGPAVKAFERHWIQTFPFFRKMPNTKPLKSSNLQRQRLRGTGREGGGVKIVFFTENSTLSFMITLVSLRIQIIKKSLNLIT